MRKPFLVTPMLVLALCTLCVGQVKKEQPDFNADIECKRDLPAAVRLASELLKDPNERPSLYPTGSLIISGSSGIWTESAPKLPSPAERLRQQADELEEQSKKVGWIKRVAKACAE